MPNKDDYTTQITRMSTNNFNTSQISDEVWEGKSFVFGVMAQNPYRINALTSYYNTGSAGCYTCVLIPNTISVSIDGSDDNWEVTFTPLSEDMFTIVTINGYSQYCFPSRIYQNKIVFNGLGSYPSVPFDSYMSTGIYPSSFATFDDAIDFVSYRFSNVDLIVNGEYWIGEQPVVPITSNGGGATHIAKVTGQLSSLSNNLSDILMVSGGGGGGLIIGEDTYAGKDAGGISGSGNNSANQTTGYAFGQGESADGVSGGGGGLYGGYSNNVDCVEKYTYDDNTKSLGIVNALTMIPSAIVNASPTTISVIQSGGSSPIPSYFTSIGDILYHNSAVTEDTITFIDNNYLKIIFGKYQHPSDQRDYYGTQIIDKIRNVSVLNFGTDSFSSGQYWDHYFSIVFDKANSRAYLLLLEYVSTGGGYNVIVVGGKTNGTDLFWESFKNYATANGGGAGSGYIGNALISNKKMVGYNVPTSSAESTKTESVNEASESPVSGKPKIGNGYARIKLIRALPDELVLYDNGQVNTDYFDTDAEIGATEAQPISKNYEVKSNHLLLEYNNWQDTTFWRGILLLFNKKTFPSVYTKVKIDLEIYAKYNSSWAAIELNVNDNQTGVKKFNNGEGVTKVSDTRYQIGGRSSFEATSRYITDEMEILDGNNYLTFEFSGVNQYHEGYAKIYKITLTM